MKLGGEGELALPLKVVEENGYIRIVAADGEWIAAMTGQPDHHPGLVRQGYLAGQRKRHLKFARLIVKAVNEV